MENGERDLHVVAICGSLSDDSGTRIALREALGAAETAGATTTLVDLRFYDLPMLDSDETGVADAEPLRETVRDANAVLLGTPMYHGSYSSPLKTALDYCGSDEFDETTVGLLAVAGGGFPRPALEHLRSVSRSLGAWTLPLEVGIPNSYSAFEDGEIVDGNLAERVRRLGEEAVRYAGVERYPEVSGPTVEPVAGD